MLAKFILVSKLIGVILRKALFQLQWNLNRIIHKHTYKKGDKNIVVIGASFAGYHTARCLANSLPTGYRVVVIEKNSHFQLTWVLPRFSVVAGHENKAFIPYSPYINAPDGACVWVHDSVAAIEPKDGTGRLQVLSGEWIDYEYLVIATGCTAELPSRVNWNSKEEGIIALQGQQRRFDCANDIVVIGGGAAGVELATDLKSYYPEKNVTLIHSHSMLLGEGFGVKIHDVVQKEMQRLGVDLVLGERPVIPDDLTGILVLRDRKVHYDCLVKCIGQKPNTDLFRFLDPSAFTPSGHLRVQETLQVYDENHRNVYAAGDVINESIKNGRSAMEQGQAVAENILRSIQGRSLVKYRQQWWEGLTKVTLGLVSIPMCIPGGLLTFDRVRVWFI
ncbi:unnamed protein product [Penicillium salamii]|nr:unnamed protein product [Penicillium salamii]CAG8391068.1 unnamed protein product [Penicillium salamii]